MELSQSHSLHYELVGSGGYHTSDVACFSAQPCKQQHQPQAYASQVAGSSPCSQASTQSQVGLDDCSLLATSAGAHNATDSSNFAAASQGWFSKCRGCGCMTAHEQTIAGEEVPFCRRCQGTLETACPVMKARMVDTLVYVHHAWSKAGL